jgi:hypothetical protein
MITAIASNTILAFRSQFYLWLWVAHVLLYLLAITGLATKRGHEIGAIRIAGYFVSVNYSILVAWVRYLRGERIVTWAPTVR